ncbi:LysR family transcriptional regulator [Ruegeria sp. Alg231-54]|uniref:LysR family transcriptional regulator n=1 Tax=Ruegeria sp. Alg231-54 TaxID=1922221 RepID=UPI00272B3D01|nr:LysR family transcriptional regulator [Ruegeria sp. Alg231-54]
MNALRAFSAVAEAGSYTVAAERLNVTQAAVSQQVKSLERHLGVALVARRGRSIGCCQTNSNQSLFTPKCRNLC